MRKIYTFFTLLSLTIAIAQDGAPASPYYDGFNFTLTGTSLRDALATKTIAKHTINLTYAQAENALRFTDLDPADATNTNVLLVYGYSDNLCVYVDESNFGTSADGTYHRRRNKNADVSSSNQCAWNREHIFAQALGNPDLGQTGPGADAHMLRTCDVDRNSLRGNKKFGAGSGNSAVVGANWYPGDEWKGDCARIVMYMYLRYGSQCLPAYVFTGTPVASDTNMLDLLLQWNAEDPVSQYEDNRNTYLGSTTNTYRQGNRNPFIDNPYLATVIWGGPAAQNRWPSLGTTPFVPPAITSTTVYPNPSNGSINIVTDLTVENIQLFSINGQLMMEIDNPVFQNNSTRIDNLPKGFYFLKLSTDDEFLSITKKIVVN
ncbi:MAG: endonuclease [Bacteroidota bacterium]